MIATDPRAPAAQLRVLLEQARVEGLTFEEAWQPSLLRVKWPHDTKHRLEWKAILGDGKEFDTPKDTFRSWRSAFYREAPSRREKPLAYLVAA